MAIINKKVTTESQTEFHVGTDGNSVMVLNSSGNVGIGTETPQTLFETATTGTTTNRLTVSSANEFTQIWVEDDGLQGILWQDGSDFTFGPAAAIDGAGWGAYITIKDGGNVGIGTTSPDAKLEVEGRATGGYTGQQETMRLSSGSTTLSNGQGPGLVFHGRVSTAGGTTELAQIVGGRDDTTNGYTSGMLAFYTRQVYTNPMVEQMRIDENGYVGIKTTNPSHYLDVNGQNVSNHMVRFLNNADRGGGNGATLFVSNGYGNHSWGIVQECRIGNSGGSDNPSILFSSATESTNTWSVGYGYTDNAFRIKTDHGLRNSGWGTARLTLDRSGNCTITGSLTQNSDERLKENIQTIENAIDTIKQLRGVTFDWIESGEESMGLIAQEVETVPVANRLVRESIDDGNMEEFKPKTVNYQNMVALLIEGIKEQQTIIDNLKSRIEALEG